MSTPLISVILPAYNAAPYIAEAVRSVLNQTCADLEVIIINDGSTDATEAELLKIGDRRIRYYRETNAGMAASLNKAVRLARGTFIARQDADDIAAPTRLEKQLRFLQDNPSIGVVGTWARIIDSEGNLTGQVHAPPHDQDEIRFFLLFDNPLVHSSVMMRKEVTETCGLYNEKLHTLIQDYEYWYRISGRFNVGNLPEYLQLYRQLSTGISFSTANFSAVVAEESARHIAAAAGVPPGEALSFAQAYHNVSVHAGQARMYEQTFRKISRLLPDSERGKKTAARHLFHLKRIVYGSIINDPRAGALEKLRYRVKRKLLFWKFAA